MAFFLQHITCDWCMVGYVLKMVYYNNFSPLASNFSSYPLSNNFYSYRYGNYNSNYSTGLSLNPYPNTLSIPINWADDFNKDLSHLAVDPATLSIVPKDLLEKPKQPDSSGLHQLNNAGGFAYHEPNQPKSYGSGTPYAFPSTMFLNFASDLFTSPQNFQYILPNGRIGTVPHTLSLGKIDYSNDIDKNNRVIYEAKKAKGDDPVRDIIGRAYNPDKKLNVTDSQDFVDESLRGQILDYYQYNALDPIKGSLENRNFVKNIHNNLLQNPDYNPLGDLFISDVLGSHTALVSPLAAQNTSLGTSHNHYNTHPLSDLLIHDILEKNTELASPLASQKTNVETPYNHYNQNYNNPINPLADFMQNIFDSSSSI
jgi:hypothetical protein